MDTVNNIRTRLKARRGAWPGICQTTGLSYWWVTKFAQCRIADPGSSKLERLRVELDAMDKADAAKAAA